MPASIAMHDSDAARSENLLASSNCRRKPLFAAEDRAEVCELFLNVIVTGGTWPT